MLVCLPINPLCYNYNSLTGSCVNCVSGYGLSSITNNCEAVNSPPPYCQTADPIGNCLACMNKYYFNSTSACVPASALCAKYILIGGKCLTCNSGYNLLSDSSCVQSNFTTGCLSADTNGLCISCSAQYIVTGLGGCLYRDPYCQNYDSQGYCIKCVQLYYILQGKCIK
jgi:hypothetical protein